MNLDTVIEDMPDTDILDRSTINTIRQLVENGECQFVVNDEYLAMCQIDTALFINRGDEFLGVLTYADTTSCGYVAPTFQKHTDDGTTITGPDGTTAYIMDMAETLYPWVIRLMQLAAQNKVRTVADDPDSIYNSTAVGNRLWRILNAVFPEQTHGWMPERYRVADRDEVFSRRVAAEFEKHASGFDPEQAEQQIRAYREAGDDPRTAYGSEDHRPE